MKSLQTTSIVTAVVLSALINSGCSVGPDYKGTKVKVSDHFTAQPTTQPGNKIAEVDLARWWETFNDPRLNHLIDEASRSNLDIQIADSRVRQARGELMGSRSDFFPTIDADASAVRGLSSTNGQVLPPGAPKPRTQTLYKAGFDAGWEIDVFGGTRRAVEAAQYNLDAQIEGRRDAMVTLLAEVAQNYIMLRGYQNELAIAERNVKLETDTLELQRNKLKAGIVTDLTVAQTEALLASTQSSVPTLQINIQQAIHRLSILLGKEPGALEDELTMSYLLPTGPLQVPPGMPSELLLRRPDIRQAERQVGVSTANIGVATADLFPKFTLNGTAGYSSLKMGSLDSGNSKYWSFGPSVSWRLFDVGQIRSQINIKTAQQEQAILEYRQTILNAFGEVEDALVAYDREQARQKMLYQAVLSNRRAVEKAQQLNNAGVIDFLNVLTAQQSLFTAEDALARSEQAVSTNLVALYKALGGGWETLENSTSTKSPTTRPQ